MPQKEKATFKFNLPEIIKDNVENKVIDQDAVLQKAGIITKSQQKAWKFTTEQDKDFVFWEQNYADLTNDFKRWLVDCDGSKGPQADFRQL